MLFNAEKKVHDYDEKQTNSNQQSSSETRVEIKQKTRAKRGFPSHKSSPKREKVKTN